MEHSPLIYDDLSGQESQIRLMTLEGSANQDGPVRCILKTVSFDSQPKVPYTALSYVWGNPSITGNIIVNGTVVQVTTNLVSALRHISSVFGETVLWVDNICINQKDLAERQAQVQLMGIIYSSAEQVIAWLGPDEDNGDYALRVFGRMIEKVKAKPANLEWLREMPELWQIDRNELDEDGKERGVADACRALKLLFDRPFWNRVWTVQEQALAPKLSFLCGSALISVGLDLIFSLRDILEHRRTSRPEFIPLHSWLELGKVKLARLHDREVLRIQVVEDRAKQELSGILHAFQVTVDRQATVSSQTPSRLFHALQRTIRCQASDPRDKIFGLLGVLGLVDPSVKTRFIPDYQASTQEVYINLARECIVNRDYEIWQYAGIGMFDGKDKAMQDLPTWVPDWDALSKGEIPNLLSDRGTHCFPCDEQFRPQVIDGRHLHWPGIIFDTISAKEARETSAGIEWDLVKRLDLAREQRYPTGISRPLALVLFMFTGRIRIDGRGKILNEDRDLFFRVVSCFLRQILWTFQEENCPQIGIDLHWRIRTFKEHANLLEGSEEEERFLRMFGCERRDGAGPPLGDMIFTHIIVAILSGAVEGYLTSVDEDFRERRVFHSQLGYIGLGPRGVEEGDLICVLRGYHRPVILRKVELHWLFVGQCYVQGIMDGEAVEVLKKGDVQTTEFEIR